MENVIFSLSRRQLSNYLVRLILLLAVVCGVTVLVTHNAVATGVGAVVVLVTLWLGAARGRTTLSRTGIEIRRPLGPRQLVDWKQVKEIRDEQRGGTRLLRVELTGGRSFPLPAPTHSALSPNPDYATERDQLLAYRKRRSGRR
ncbi:PH domain-containing protein [Kitasatospora sp. GAS204B]|uniref:PH domain-containing protein n=1 Tax=unclassified Kitasatospora TaxID=2633591 RepID=UPI002474A4C0|nr:PH domain-containing protein [Kitasatospora sp. GAS204B]MDH6121293.1 hypothetical protein [Kitasatospora sp. GAS204B]